MARILLAEDDVSLSGFLALALEKAGHSVKVTHNGLEAYKALEKEPEAFDLLLSDIVMPGMDGVELSQKATKICPSLKVMFITGFTGVAVGHKDLSADKAKVLSKPFHLNDLVKQIDLILSTPDTDEKSSSE